ncbi:hypothetical protein [Sphingopyxis sp.]|uniref:hypothetical protein n=1 Tax=Sphingopyxis sp. TaxID=1908224 RepID=UPI003D0E3350
MSIGRWRLAALFGLFALAPLAARAEPGPATAKPEIVVTAAPKPQKRSGWKQAETEHVVVQSNGSEPELVRVTETLERLHALMTRLYGSTEPASGVPKLHVLLLDDDTALRGLKPRFGEGPFADAFADQRYYDPRADGTMLAVVRRDQIIDLDTAIARNRFCDELAADDKFCMGKTDPNAVPIGRSWEAVLYSAFAQHFILANVPAAYPRWYLDGVGALFSTIKVRKNGALDYAQPPDRYKLVFRSFGDINARAVLTGTYLDAPSRTMRWTPYHAWLITHYFVFSDARPAVRDSFDRYMAAIGRGATQAEAAQAFGDLGRLNRDIAGYASRKIYFARADIPEAIPAPPVVTLLSPAGEAVIEAQLRLGDLPPVLANAGETIPAPWIDGLRSRLAGLPFDADAALVAVEAECRSAEPDACLADASRVLEQVPQNARALAWQGVALVGKALAGPPGERAAALGKARQTLTRAIEGDPDDAVAVTGYFQSFVRAGEPAPETAMAGLARIAARAPAAPGPRLLMGGELLREGKADLAQRLLRPVLYGAYDSPEKTAARALFPASPLPATPQAGQ